jgi:hypothetical protein
MPIAVRKSSLFGLNCCLANNTTKVSMLADLQAVDLSRAVNGRTKSYYATASAVWDLTPGWRVVLTGVGSSPPYVKQGCEGLLKVDWNGGRTIVQESRP